MFGAFQAKTSDDNTKTVIKALNLYNQEVEMTINIPYGIFLTQWENYANGDLIQNAFPTLSAEEREFIISGTDSKEWEEMFLTTGTENIR